MTNSNGQITNAILLTLFPKICRLEDYLLNHLDIEFLREDDPLELKELLGNTLVTDEPVSINGKVDLKPSKEFPVGNKPNPKTTQNEIVDYAIELLCSNTRWSNASNNILAIGSSKSRKYYIQPEIHSGNSFEAFVRSPSWEMLLKRIGDASMLYLLTCTSIFVSLSNNCYCQITGSPISDHYISKQPIRKPSSLLKKNQQQEENTPVSSLTKTLSTTNPSLAQESITTSTTMTITSWERSKKSRSRLKSPQIKKHQNGDTIVSIPDITFKRSKIFYFKCYQTQNTMLQRFLLNGYSTGRSSDSNSISLVDSLMLRMFPRQYGLSNVFAQKDVLTGGGQGRTNKSRLSHPWRLRQMKQHVEGMLTMNSRCMSKLLLQYHCPVKAIDKYSEEQDTSTATLLKCYSSFDQVTSFIHAIIKKVIPLAMFGSVENRAIILRAMTRFIRLRKFENMSLQYALQGFKLSDCKWLQDERLAQPESRVSHVPPSASNKQHEILNEFIYWLFDGFLMPLLQAGFYVTDSSFHRNRVFYYRHELWQLITKPAVSLIQREMFVQMKPEEIDVCNRAYAKVRLLPKTNDLRPIINLRKRSPKLVNGQVGIGAGSINQKLANAFMILTYESGRQLSQKTSSAIGMSDLYQRFKLAKAKLVDPTNPNPPKLFMVKVDIRKSFDSINQVKLLEIIDKTLKEDKYMIHRYSKIMPSNGQMTKRFLLKAVDPKEMGSFIDFARDQAELSKHAVLVDKVVHTFENKKSVLDCIRDHISNNIVKFGKHFYRQTTGIPQGSMLSPALCRFFYDEMELNTLLDLSNSHDSALLRLADDFLFISQVQEKAETFLNIMSQGHPEYGCYINEKKTIANFDVELNGMPVQKCQGNDFPYCGLLIHTKSLEIGADYSRYHSEDIRDLLTIGRDTHPGRFITQKMKRAMQHMCQVAFSDTTLNSVQKVMVNIYQNFIFCAMKFHAYCKELSLDPVTAVHIQPLALPQITKDIFKACFGLLHSGRRSIAGSTAGAKFTIVERHVHWLGATAFMRTLPILPIYEPLRGMLRDQIIGPIARNENSHFKRMLHSAARDERNIILNNIQYK